MKLLTKLRELRNQASDFSAGNFLNPTCEIDFETIGIGAIATSDIIRLYSEKDLSSKAPFYQDKVDKKFVM